MNLPLFKPRGPSHRSIWKWMLVGDVVRGGGKKIRSFIFENRWSRAAAERRKQLDITIKQLREQYPQYVRQCEANREMPLPEGVWIKQQLKEKHPQIAAKLARGFT